MDWKLRRGVLIAVLPKMAAILTLFASINASSGGDP
jgi:hypothetical protein